MSDAELKKLAALLGEELRRNPVIHAEWMSMKHAAAYCDFAEQTFSKFVHDGTAPPSILISRNARRFRRSDLDSWMLARGKVVRDA